MTKSEQDQAGKDASVWTTSGNTVGCDIKGEMILLHLQSNTYFGLNQIGAEIWSLLRDGKTSAQIQQHLLARYKVSPSRCEAEVSFLLAELYRRDLIVKTANEKAA